MKNLKASQVLPASFLYVPAHQETLFHKALNSHAHALIVDLEDGVPASEKNAARALLKTLFAEKPEKPVYIRINSGALLEEDLAAARKLPVDGIVFTKAEADIIPVLQSLENTEFKKVCLIESAAGLNHLEELSQHCDAFAIGRQDLSADLRIDATDPALLMPYLNAIVLQSRIAGIAAPIAPTYINVRETDQEAISDYSRMYYRHGFRSQTAIHPKFLDSIHTVFLPTKEEYEDAKNIIRQAEQQPENFVDTSGKFIDAAVLRQYQEVVDRYEHT